MRLREISLLISFDSSRISRFCWELWKQVKEFTTLLLKYFISFLVTIMLHMKFDSLV